MTAKAAFIRDVIVRLCPDPAKDGEMARAVGRAELMWAALPGEYRQEVSAPMPEQVARTELAETGHCGATHGPHSASSMRATLDPVGAVSNRDTPARPMAEQDRIDRMKAVGGTFHPAYRLASQKPPPDPEAVLKEAIRDAGHWRRLAESRPADEAAQMAHRNARKKLATLKGEPFEEETEEPQACEEP